MTHCVFCCQVTINRFASLSNWYLCRFFFFPGLKIIIKFTQSENVVQYGWCKTLILWTTGISLFGEILKKKQIFDSKRKMNSYFDVTHSWSELQDMKGALLGPIFSHQVSDGIKHLMMYAGTLPQWHQAPPNNSPIDAGKGRVDTPSDSLTQSLANDVTLRTITKLLIGTRWCWWCCW